MHDLHEQIALVTGGASGIGKAIAARLSDCGARVVITDIQSKPGDVTGGGTGTFIQQDVSDESRWVDVVQQTERLYGRLDILVNNAGIVGPADAITPETTQLRDWKHIFAVNVEGAFLGCRAAIPAMRRAGGGAIINISSIAALLATPDALAYGASKAAVTQLTRSVAQYCAQEKLSIRCNSVHPGHVRTPLLERHVAQTAAALRTSPEQVIARTRHRIPIGEFTLPGDVAAVVCFLVSEEARHITGTQVIVDGGVVGCDTFVE